MKFPCPMNPESDCGYPACAHADQCRQHDNAETFTIEEIADYIAGWIMLPADSDFAKTHNLAVSYSISQLRDEQDGIKATRDRKISSANARSMASPGGGSELDQKASTASPSDPC